jgi:curved DNA-binding protein CbpA
LKLEASGATVSVFMTDCFELLQEPRRPWLDADALKARFLELSAAAHPDRVHGGTESERAHANARSAELNAAYNTLRESRDRLFHLLELERGAPSRDIQRIPAGTMDLFVEIGQCCRDADTFLATNPNSESPMLKLQRMRQALEWSDRLMALQRQVNLRREVLETTLRGLNAAWESAPPPSDPDRKNHLPLESLEDAARAMSYVSRWTSQLQERLGQLAS